MQYIILVLRLRVSNVFHRQHNRMDGCVLNPQETCGGSSSELATPLTFMEEVVQIVMEEVDVHSILGSKVATISTGAFVLTYSHKLFSSLLRRQIS